MMKHYKSVVISFILVLTMAIPAFADSTSDATATAAIGVVSASNGNQSAQQSQDQQMKQGQANINVGPQVELNQIGAPIPRSFPIPGQVAYAPMPQEFGNGSVDGNVQDLKVICNFMVNPVSRAVADRMDNSFMGVRIQSHNLYGTKDMNEKKAEDSIVVVFEKPANVKLAKVGSVVASVKDGTALTEEALSMMMLEAMNMKGAKYLLLLAQGVQKITKTSGWGIALGYTHAFISDDGQKAGTGTAGIGYSSGEAGRKSNPWIQAVVLGDEESVKDLQVKK
jgi:hypothetical protein